MEIHTLINQLESLKEESSLSQHDQIIISQACLELKKINWKNNLKYIIEILSPLITAYCMMKQ